MIFSFEIMSVCSFCLLLNDTIWPILDHPSALVSFQRTLIGYACSVKQDWRWLNLCSLSLFIETIGLGICTHLWAMNHLHFLWLVSCHICFIFQYLMMYNCHYLFLDARASLDLGYEREGVSKSMSLSHFLSITIVRCYRIY